MFDRIHKGLCTMALLLVMSIAQGATMDSLWANWQDRSLSEEQRFENFHAYITTSDKFIALDTVERDLNRFIDYALKHERFDFAADGLFVKGELFQNSGQYAKAHTLFNRAASYALKNQAYAKFLKNRNYAAATLLQQDRMDAARVMLYEVIEAGKGYNLPKQVSIAYSTLGATYSIKGQYQRAIEFQEQAILIAQEHQFEDLLLDFNINVGRLHYRLKNYHKAIGYYERALTDSDKEGIINSSIATCYFELGRDSSALEYANKALEVSRNHPDKRVEIGTLLLLGKIYDRFKQPKLALDYLNQARTFGESMTNVYSIAKIYTEIGNHYNYNQQYGQALRFCLMALDKGKAESNMKTNIATCSCLYTAYKQQSDHARALRYYELLHKYQDSLHTEQSATRLEQFEMDRAILQDSLRNEAEKHRIQLQHEQEVASQRLNKNIMAGTALLLFIIGGAAVGRLRLARRAKTRIEQERNKSEQLLLNILPEEVADELKQTGSSRARRYENVTVLFTDFKHFTQAAEQMEPEDLVHRINDYFKAFDAICEKHDIEKIKTIGDSYMAAGGLINHDMSQTKRTVLAALEMMDYVKQQKTEAEEEENARLVLDMRIGLNTGPLVAGIVGDKKFQYDLWGDTVNIASRMESHGEVNRINISKSTYHQIKDEPEFSCKYRGFLNIKGKGEMDMYFVDHTRA